MILRDYGDFSPYVKVVSDENSYLEINYGDEWNDCLMSPFSTQRLCK